MALVIADRVRETSTTTGTGTYTLAGAVIGHQAFSVIGDANTTHYCATDGTDWEVGTGTYTASGTTLARTTILASSNADAAVDWSAGTRNIYGVLPATTIGDLISNVAFDTLAELNAIVTDATLIDTADSRLSDSRACNNTFDVAATARTNLGVDAAGTDNSIDVTFAGTGTYISLAGQVITVDPITESDISDLGAYVVGPGSSTDNAIARYDSTTGKLVQNSGVLIDDSNNVDIPGTLSVGTGHTVSGTLASVTGGSTNTNAADYGFLGGGELCSIASGADHSVIVGGYNNDITSTSHDIFLGGGNGNSITGAVAIQAVLVGGSANTIAARYTFIGSGASNSIAAAADYAFLGGGASNSIAAGASYSFIGGGQLCSIAASSQHSVLVGGNNCDITATGHGNFIGGGIGNTITTALTTSAIIVGGSTNTTAGDYSFIGGGQLCSIADGSDNSSIVGGYNLDITSTGTANHISGGSANTITGTATRAGIVGGFTNIVSADYGFIGGGSTNTNAAPYGFLGGGQNCSIADGSDHSVIVGGYDCDITSTGHDNFIGGGNVNKITGIATAAVIAAGLQNTCSASYSTIVGGYLNDITGSGYSFVGGGSSHSLSGIRAVICGGSTNTNTATMGFIGGGQNNTASGTYSVVCGGSTNTNNAYAAFIGSGELCSIAASADHSVVVGGYNNDITGTGHDCVISGGNGNQITGTGTSNVICGGLNSTVSGSYSFLGGGYLNSNSAQYAFLGGGQNCSIAAGAEHSVIVGGNNNDITGTGDDCFIGGGNAIQITGNGGQNVAVGGYANTISATGQYNFIGSGWGNDITINAYNAVLVGGKDNDNAASYAFLGGGELCSIASGSNHSVLVGGYNCDIAATGHDNFIGGGNANKINTALTTSATVVGGASNTTSGDYSFIGGGKLCSIADGSDHSVVVGGYNNDITGTGDDCVISGGNGNQIDSNALSATITGGTGNVASAAYSEASGYQSSTRALQGAVANANGQVAAVGDRQTRSVVMRRQTTTDTFLSLTADGGADSTSDTFQQPENSLASLTWTVIGLQSTGAKAAQYTVKALVKRYTSTTTILLNSVTPDFEDDATWDCQVIVYSLGATVQAKGASGETVNWCAKLESVEVVN